jgi:tetratricopeptide (TPR) repeat protein
LYSDKKYLPGMQLNLENQKDLIRHLHRAGATVLVGTSSNSTGVVPGFAMVEEIQNLHRLGFTSYQSLRAATYESAIALRQSALLGSISAGKQADMVLLDANPLSDLANLTKRLGVMSRGKWMPISTLRQSLAAVPAKYDQLVRDGAKAIKSGPDAVTKFYAECDPQKTLAQLLVVELIKSDGEAGFEKFVSQMVAKNPKDPDYNENGINNLGYWMMTKQKQIGLAIKIFAVNVRRYPKSANTYDSLGEGYLKLGNRAKAIVWYRQAARVDPNFPNAQKVLKQLGAK